MPNKVYSNDITKTEKSRFESELKLFVNRRLYDKHIISEDMYIAVRELLMRQAD